MAKKNRKRYTAEQKYEYHKKRADDKSVSKNQRMYSDYWLTGFRDVHVNYNLPNREEKFKRDYRKMDKSDRIVCKATINGNREAIKNPETARKHWYE